MILSEEKHELDGKEVVLRSATKEDAQTLIDYLKTVSGETRYLLCYPDEIEYTMEQEYDFIKSRNEAEDGMLVLAFVDGRYAGNCSFQAQGPGRRAKHRADFGIALFQEFTGFGLGRLMLERIISEIKKMGFEQAELTVVSENERAIHLYKSLGFTECGRIPRANRYDDGTYSDDIHMVLSIKGA